MLLASSIIFSAESLCRHAVTSVQTSLDSMAKSTSLPRPTEMAHRLLRERLQTGDQAIDATVGNGHDTLFLAEQVGSEGHVYGFDVQESAIEKTRQSTAGLTNITLRCVSHELLDEFVSGPISAITFNLGYFPGGDKSIITKPDTTLVALRKSVKVLKAGGLLTIVAYVGHEGGLVESNTIAEWASNLDQSVFSTVRYEFTNQRNTPPFLIAVERRYHL